MAQGGDDIVEEPDELVLGEATHLRIGGHRLLTQPVAVHGRMVVALDVGADHDHDLEQVVDQATGRAPGDELAHGPMDAALLSAEHGGCLVGDVVEQGSPAHADGAGEVVHREAVVAALDDQAAGGGMDLLLAGDATPPGGRFCTL